MDKYSIGFATFFCGIAVGAALMLPLEDSSQKLMAKGAIAVYENRAVCEKALDQWVCSIPKE